MDNNLAPDPTPAGEPANGEPAKGDPAKGLPPVTPPSGRFIVQLFLVPGLIVAGVVLFFLAIQYWVGDSRTPDQFLRKLGDENTDVRWRAASDLAQMINRRENSSMRSDAKFALDLAELLRKALDELWEDEKIHAQRLKDKKASPEEVDRSWKKLAPKRDYVNYLAAVLASFHMAVGAPLLGEMAEKADSPDAKGNILRRRNAVSAIANLGNQCKDFKKLSAEDQQAIRERLKLEAAAQTSRGLWARTALYYLDKTTGSTGIVPVDQVLARVAKADDRFLRAQVALALFFWDGDLVEPTLLELTRDDGFGHMMRIEEN